MQGTRTEHHRITKVYANSTGKYTSFMRYINIPVSKQSHSTIYNIGRTVSLYLYIYIVARLPIGVMK